MQRDEQSDDFGSTRAETIHARLKRSTAALHQEVERALPLVSPELTLARYRDVLQRFYGFHAPHEQRMTALASSLPFPLRDRSAQLEQDLRTLGLSVHQIQTLPRCHVPPLRRIEQLAGCLYVFEGAALGGQVVARALRDNLGLDSTRGACFFAGDRSATRGRWRQVLRWLDDAAGDPATIVASACETFLRLRDWLERL